MIKALISDIDGTIIRDGQIDEETRKTIRYFMADGLVILNTGRSFESIQSLKEEFAFADYDIAITCNGSYICTKEGKVLLNESLPQDIIQPLLDHLSESKLKIASAGKIKTVNPPYALPADFSMDGINKISIRLKDEAFLQELKTVASKFNVRLEINTHFADLIPVQCDKANGTEYLLKQLQIKPNEVVLIGDDYNDISMLKVFPNTYTFSTSPMEVQHAAKHIIDRYETVIACLNEQR